MKLIRQLDYPALLYPTTLEENVPLQPPYPSIAKSGCGLCCICMMVQSLSDQPLSVEKCIQLSIQAKANYFGTDMRRLAPVIAHLYHLKFYMSNEINDVITTLGDGGRVIVNVGKPNGLLSDGGHFVLADGAKNGFIQILDPSYSQEKYEKPYRKGLVSFDGEYVLLSPSALAEQSSNRDPSFYIFVPNILK